MRINLIICALLLLVTNVYATEKLEPIKELADFDAVREPMEITVTNVTCNDDIARLQICNGGIPNETTYSGEFKVFGFTVLEAHLPIDNQTATSTPMTREVETPQRQQNIDFTHDRESSALTKNGCMEISMVNSKGDERYRCGDTVSLHGGSTAHRDIVINIVLPK